ncbi:hypothetical protein [Usitatibacter palustris]|uniref:hypothetical protein n=1 Tax=Usitatibacter palustris TaxID=2732487 RepID=UPI00148943AA|nr:hypothetical protein [Usitatibacter palustris]
MKLDSLWDEHRNAPFPPASKGVDIEGTDLVFLDMCAAGCIDYYVVHGHLDEKRVATLKECARLIEVIVPKVEPESRGYFERLGKLTAFVLEGAGHAA